MLRELSRYHDGLSNKDVLIFNFSGIITFIVGSIFIF